MNSRTSFGFTLIELLVVISIIALLSSVVVSTLTTARVKARDTSRIANARQLALALEQYEMTTGTYAVAGAGYQGTGSGYASYVGGVDYTTSIVSALKSSGTYSSSRLSDPLYGDQNYFIGRCTSTLAYALYLKVEQDALKQDPAEIAAGCDGATAVSLGFNYVAGGNGAGAFGGSVAGGGGGGESSNTYAIAATSNAGFALVSGALYTWGTYNLGQMGIPGNSYSPTRVGSFSDWRSISSGSSHTLGIRSDGSLWVWGSNSFGELGLGDTTLRNSPTRLGVATDWKQAITGKSDMFSLALKNDGTMWSWGYDGYGQLGIGTTTHRSSPVQVGTDSDWSQIFTGGGFAAALKSNGALYMWGQNNRGQLGLNDTTHRYVPTQVGGATWTTIALGRQHTLALHSDGSLYVWGDNNWPILGLGTWPGWQLTPQLHPSGSVWSKIAACDGASYGIKQDGTLWSWGYNGTGQLGLATSTTLFNTPQKVGSWNDWSTISGGTYTAVGTRSSGAIYSWGWNNIGQLGLGDTVNRSAPVEVIIP